jgi:hypothetical protein
LLLSLLRQFNPLYFSQSDTLCFFLNQPLLFGLFGKSDALRLLFDKPLSLSLYLKSSSLDFSQSDALCFFLFQPFPLSLFGESDSLRFFLY